MKQRVDGMRRNKLKKIPKLNIFLVYILVIVIMDLIFYPLFPILLNYPPGSINSQFDIEFSRIPYYQQYIVINFLIMTFGYFLFKLAFKGVDKWSDIVFGIESNDTNCLKRIRRKSFSIPHTVYILQIVIPLIFVGFLFTVLGFRNTSDLKFFLILTNGLLLSSEVSYLFSKKYFREVLKYTYHDDFEIKTARISLRLKIILQTLPLFLFSIIFTLLIGRAGLIKEKGDLLFKNYQRELKHRFENVLYIENESQIELFLSSMLLDNKTDVAFYIAPNDFYKTSNNSVLSKFFLKYTKELAFKYNGHTYDYYGTDIQGAVIRLPGKKGDWIIGIKYLIKSPETGIMIVVSIIILIMFAVFILLFFSKSLSDDIVLITTGLNEIAKGSEDDLNRKIVITSNDEIGDLVLAFNKVQEREKKYIQNIKEQQKIIVEQERLASLGQMIGGIIHNLKTPIISIKTAIRALNDLVREYQASIGDRRVTKDDHLEIAAEMESWITEIKPYCDYMNDVLTTVKGQIIQGKSSLKASFTLKELLKRVEIITHYELKKSRCVINYDVRVNINLIIPGEISNLVQVLENIISNSIQAYQGKVGTIDFIVVDKGNLIQFQIKDSARGIPDNIKNRLFKEIITTKGNKGTGLGLYISSAIIKGRFGGEIWFESLAGEGTVFYISIPLSHM